MAAARVLDDGEASEIAALRGDLRTLRAEVDAADAHEDAAGAEAESQLPAAAEAAVGPVALAEPEAIASAERAWGDDYSEQLDERLAAEPVDSEWAREGQALAENAFASIGSESVVGAPSCRSTLCRVEITHGGEEGHDAAVAAIRDDHTWRGPFIAIPTHGDSGPKTVVYLGREGANLPDPRSAVHDFLEPT